MRTALLASSLIVFSSASPALAQNEGPAPGEAAPPPAIVDSAPADAVPEPAPAEAAPQPPPPPPSRVRVYEPAPRLEVPPPTPIAPNTYRHDGFYVRVASSLQYFWFEADGPTESKSFEGFGAGFLLAVGGTPVDGLVIGGAFMGGGRSSRWTGVSDEGDDVELGLGQIGLLVDWHPDARGGWHVGGIVGVSGNVLTADDNEQYTGVTGSVSVLGGYDFWIGPQWAIGVHGLASFSPSVTLKDDDQEDTEYKLGGATLGLGASILHH
jgi:hypothetical protein